MILITIVFNIQKYQEAKPTSGHLKLIRSKKNQQDDEQKKSKIEERAQEKSMQKPVIFLGFYEHCKC